MTRRILRKQSKPKPKRVNFTDSYSNNNTSTYTHVGQCDIDLLLCLNGFLGNTH